MSLNKISVSFSAFVLLCAASAFAAPKIGDSTQMDGMLIGTGMTAKVSTLQKVIAFNSNTAVYTVQQTQTVGSQTQSKEVNVAASDMMSEEDAAMIVTYCESQNIGTKETIHVPAGTFETCRATTNDGTVVWIASVPFGIAKLQTKVSVGTVNLSASAVTRGM